MKRPLFYCVAIAILLAANYATAQVILPPGTTPLTPPLPPPLPPPKISVPVVPQLDAPQRPNYQPAPQPSFGDRINRCLEEGAAAGFGPADREAYSRACANR